MKLLKGLGLLLITPLFLLIMLVVWLIVCGLVSYGLTDDAITALDYLEDKCDEFTNKYKGEDK